jgi:hypothetical protein
MILCSECVDKIVENQTVMLHFSKISPQAKCQRCGRECLGYEISLPADPLPRLTRKPRKSTIDSE